MKYLCLVYNDEKLLDAMPCAEFQALVDEHLAYNEALRNSGHFIAAEALEWVAAATTVRVRNGRLSVTDGPFAETKEQLNGFYLVDAADLNDAIRVASRIPAVRVGTIEVRPIRELIGSTIGARASYEEKSS